MIKISLLPPILHAKAKLLTGGQEIHRLLRRKYPYKLPQSAQPQLISLLQNLRHGAAVLIQRRLHTAARRIAPRALGFHGDRRQGVVQHVLLQARQPGRKLPLFPNRLPLQLVHQGNLPPGELPEVPDSDALEELSELRLDLEAAEGVDEADVGGGAAAADPEHRPLERRAPGRREVRRHVDSSHVGSFLHVVLEVVHDFLDELAELGVGGETRVGF